MDQKLWGLIALVLKWNRSINLTAATTQAEIVEHIADCVPAIELLRGRARVLDVGSGGGFPVLPAAILLPESSFVALEPVHKKHAFLRTAVRELGLSNLDPRAQRLEDHDVHDYDAATSRATFDLREWLERGRKHVVEGGIVLGFEAVPRDDLPDGTERHPYELGDKQRAIVLVRR